MVDSPIILITVRFLKEIIELSAWQRIPTKINAIKMQANPSNISKRVSLRQPNLNVQ